MLHTALPDKYCIEASGPGSDLFFFLNMSPYDFTYNVEAITLTVKVTLNAVTVQAKEDDISCACSFEILRDEFQFIEKS